MSLPCIRHGSAEWMPIQTPCCFASRQGVNQLLLVRVDGQCPSRGWRGRSCVDRVRGGTRVRFTDNMWSTALGGQCGLRGHTCARHPPSRGDTNSNQSTHSPKHPLQVTNTHTPRSTALKVIYKLFLPPIIAFGNGSRQLHRHRTRTRQHHVAPVLNGL